MDAPHAAPQRPQILVQTEDVRIVEYTLAPGERHPWHHHSQVTDRVYCLEGVIGVDLRDASAHHALRPGQSFAVPAGTIHRVGNAGDSAGRYLLIQALGRYDYIRAE